MFEVMGAHIVNSTGGIFSFFRKFQVNRLEFVFKLRPNGNDFEVKSFMEYIRPFIIANLCLTYYRRL